MSETNEPKLSPCPVCGGEAKYEIYGDENEYALVACKQCGFWFPAPNEDVDIVEIWNRRTPPVPQWTTEPPKELGWYIFCGKYVRHIYAVEVVSDRENQLCFYWHIGHISSNSMKILIAEVNEKMAPIWKSILNEPDDMLLWQKIEMPPLPEERKGKERKGKERDE